MANLGTFYTRPSDGQRYQVESYLRQGAVSRGLNPDIIARGIKQESGFNPAALGDNGRSYGVMQLFTGGGLGNVAQAQGISLDSSNWRQQVDFGLDVMKDKGTGQWYGFRDSGITDPFAAHKSFAGGNFSADGSVDMSDPFGFADGKNMGNMGDGSQPIQGEYGQFSDFSDGKTKGQGLDSLIKRRSRDLVEATDKQNRAIRETMKEEGGANRALDQQQYQSTTELFKDYVVRIVFVIVGLVALAAALRSFGKPVQRVLQQTVSA